MHHTVKDLTGKRFGRLLVKSISDKRYKSNGTACWNCVCDCGCEVIARSDHLNTGRVVSCGCRRREYSKSRFERFGIKGPAVSVAIDTSWQSSTANAFNNELLSRMSKSTHSTNSVPHSRRSPSRMTSYCRPARCSSGSVSSRHWTWKVSVNRLIDYVVIHR